jgi:hypothetical protein
VEASCRGLIQGTIPTYCYWPSSHNKVTYGSAMHLFTRLGIFTVRHVSDPYVLSSGYYLHKYFILAVRTYITRFIDACGKT